MKKFLRKLFAAVLPLCLVFLPVHAAPYKYRVTIYAGLQGTVNGQEKLVLEFEKGQEWNSNNFTVVPNDDRYFCNYEFEYAGQEGSWVSVLKVESDVDLVPVYRLAGDMVEYRVQYLHSGDNAVLLPQQTFFGNIGDKPVVAYRFLEGYIPTAYAETKTISADPAENTFTFYYLTLEEARQQIIDRGEIFDGYYYDGTAYVPAAGGGAAAGAGGTGTATEAAGAGTTSETAGADTSSEAAAPGNNGTGTDSNNEINNNQTPTTQPQDIVDLDENEVPQALNPDEPGNNNTGGNSALPWVAGIAAIAVLVALIVFLITRKKEHEEGE